MTVKNGEAANTTTPEALSAPPPAAAEDYAGDFVRALSGNADGAGVDPAADKVDEGEAESTDTEDATTDESKTGDGQAQRGTKPDKAFEDKLAALAKEQQKMRATMEATEAKLKEREKAIQEREQKLNVDDPIAVLEAYGYTFEDVNSYLVNGKKVTPELRASKVEREMKKLREEQAAKEKAYQEQVQQARNQEALTKFKSRMLETAKAGADKYELVNSAGAIELAFKILDDHMKETQEWPGGSETAAIQFALEQAEETLDKQLAPLLQTKKVRGKIQPEASRVAEAQAAKVKPPPKTLNGQLTGRAPPRAQDDEEDIDPEVLKAKFVAALRKQT